jgi:hypothetical protein
MAGLEGLLRKGMPLGLVAALGCTGNRDSGQVPDDSGRESSYTDDSGTETDDSGHTGDTDTYTTCDAPVIDTSTLQQTAYLNIPFTYSVTATQSDGAGALTCRIDELPFDVSYSDNGCTMSFTVTDQFMVGETYNPDVEVEDSCDEDEATLELTIAEYSGTLSLGTLADLSGYTNETLSGYGSYTGAAEDASITFDSTLDAVVASSSASVSSGNVNYSVTFRDDIDWSDYTLGTIEGTATVEVCDSSAYCVSQNVDVIGYAATEILITAQTADDKDPLSSAAVGVDCNSGESYTVTPNADGEATAYLNNSEDVCTITSDAGSDYAVYSWSHEIDSASDDLVSDGYYEVWAEVYDNFTPSNLESEYGESDCYSGRLGSSSRNLLMYAGNMLDIVDGTDYGDRDFQRYSEDQLTDTIKYWVSETNLNDGSTTDTDLYIDMYDAVADGLERINNENSLGYTFFEEAGVIDDANYVVFWGESGNTNTSCNFNANDVIETYATGEYCATELRTASERTVMEEAMNTISIDLCGDSITSGGNSFTTIDWFVWNTIHFARYQNLMERTY